MQETSGRSPRRDEVGSWVSWAHKCEGCDGKTSSYASGKSDGWLRLLPKWHSTESPDTLETQRHRCTLTEVTQTADTRTDATSTRNATCSTCEQWGRSLIQYRRCATRICVYTYPSSQWSISRSWSICQESQAWSRFLSRFADWWRNIHWLVCYLLHGNAADIHFADDSSQLSEPDSEYEHWPNGTGFLSLLFSIISGHFKVYLKGYIYMYY